jgi:hypothetical protein
MDGREEWVVFMLKSLAVSVIRISVEVVSTRFSEAKKVSLLPIPLSRMDRRFLSAGVQYRVSQLLWRSKKSKSRFGMSNEVAGRRVNSLRRGRLTVVTLAIKGLETSATFYPQASIIRLG